MKLATIRLTDENGAEVTRAVKLSTADGTQVHVDLGVADLGTFLADAEWHAKAVAATPAGAATYAAEDADFAPVVPNPSKIVCVGLNYRSHIEEMGRDLPQYPVLFAKFADTLAGANDDIVKPAETEMFDWECELTVVVGRTVRHASERQAADAIAGFTAAIDYSLRDWQFRTREWLQGKVWEATTPVGPYLVTPDELQGGVRPRLDARLTVDGAVKQTANTSDLLFDPVWIVKYVSTMITLRPGDLILTGTNGGVGHARDPQEFLWGGETVEIAIQGIGAATNRIVEGRTL